MHEPARATNRLLAAIVVFLAGAALKLAAPVVIALLLTALLVYLIDPLVALLTRRRLPLWAAAVISIVFFAALFAGIGVLIFFDLPHFARTFPRFQDELVKRARLLMDNLESSLGVTIVFDPFQELASAPTRAFLMGLVRSSIRRVSEFALIFFLAVILLLGKYRVIRTILTAFPRRHSMVPIILRHIDRHLRSYLGIKMLAGLTIGILVSVILLAFRVEFAVTWGFLTVLLNFIPTLGPITAIALPTLISMIQFPTFVTPIAIVCCLGVVHLTISNFIEPRILGERLNLNFFVIFLSLFFWGWMWGPAGILLGVPVTASLKIVLEHIPATSRIALLLGRVRRSASMDGDEHVESG